MKKSIKVISIILTLALVTCFANAAFASGLDEKKKDLAKQKGNIKNNITETKDKLESVKDEQNQVVNQLDTIQKDLANKEKELEKVEAHLSDTQEKLIHTQKELEEAKEKANEYENDTAERLRAMYMNGTSSYLEVLLEAKSMHDLLNRIVMVQELVSFDAKTLDRLENYKGEIAQKHAILKEQEEEVTKTKTLVSRQKREIESKKQEKAVLLEELKKEQERCEKELSDLEETSKGIEAEIQKIEKELEKKRKEEEAARKRKQQELTRKNKKPKNERSSYPVYSGGVLAWPTPSTHRITSGYGYRYHPILGYKKFHSGIDIGASYGSTIIAAEDGVVIHAGNRGGYGKCVIISHGGSISTLYGHGSSILVENGQSVKRGQAIMKVGSTGVSTGPHLHFEVRKNGSPVNPMTYLK
ncbi:murein hydrolase activator EnvC family protein [Xylanivirga thermophila]|uniref:murein hydrolase activator EnvC family protein n=1 Tax=Xylanivirga thermophila TaxID=2496273 RepID=UPI001A937D19|nr:M23 family metallopeptidase [Xylanivirga thermophila]